MEKKEFVDKIKVCAIKHSSNIAGDLYVLANGKNIFVANDEMHEVKNKKKEMECFSQYMQNVAESTDTQEIVLEKNI